jgi:hypothetical protein
MDRIIRKVRRADIEFGSGKKVSKIHRVLQFTGQTYYR